MKNKKLTLSFLMVLLLVFGLIAPVAAQDGGMPGVNCNGLSEEDCAVLTEASMALQEGQVQSFTMPAWAIDAHLDAGAESVNFQTGGSGRVVLPASAMALFSDMQPMVDATGNYDLDAVIAFYEQLDADLIISFLQGLGLHLDIEQAMLEAPGQSMAGSAEIIFKDMGLYLRLPAPTGAETWFGDMLEITDEMKAELDATLDEMIAGLQDEEMQDMMEMSSGMTEALLPLADLANAHVMTTREADAELFGQSMYVFTTSFDLKGFLTDPALPVAIMTLLEDPALAELNSEEMGLEINETQIQFILMTAGMLIGDTSFSSTQWIGMDDMLPHKLALDVALDVDLSLLGDPEMQSVTGGLSFMVEMDQFNTATMDAVEVPAEYEPLELVDSYMVGAAGMIEDELTLGQTYSGSFGEDDSEDVFAVTLEAGQTVKLELASEDYPYLKVYGPDGFMLDEFDAYYDEEMTISADSAGQYLIVVEGWWDMDYDLTVRAQ